MTHHLRVLAAKLRGFLADPKAHRELDHEIQTHLELLTERYMRQGMSDHDAARAARLQFGSVTQLQETNHDLNRFRFIDSLARDLRYAVRVLRKNPGFTLVVTATLALGIGANAAIFSVVNAVLLRPFAYNEPERLVVLQERYSNGAGGTVSYPNFADWRQQQTALTSVSAVRGNESFNFTGSGEPERLQGRIVSAAFFSTLGITPMLGRDFRAEEDRPGATPVVILSHGFWHRRFANDQGIIGRQLTLNNQSYTVIGIAPQGFQYGVQADVTVPIGLTEERFRQRGADPGIGVVARLKPNVSQLEAEANLNVIAARLEQVYPKSNTGRRVTVTPLHESVVGGVRRSLLILLGAVGLVLLIACANVANLLLVRSQTRHREMAVRLALGASRGTLIRQLLTESVLLAGMGAVLGILLAFWATRLIASQLPDGIPRIEEAQIDAPVLGLTLVLSLLTGLLFGLIPALQSSRSNLTEGLKEGDRGSSGARQRMRSLLIVSEIALTLTLLVGAALLIQSFRRVLQVDPGFKPENLLTMQVSVSHPDGQHISHFFEQLQRNIRALPGVKSVAVSNGLPFGVVNRPTFLIEGRPDLENKPSTVRYTVSPGYFETLGIELIRGRYFTSDDTRERPHVVVINEVLARYAFPDEDPLGKRLKQRQDGPSLEIVGVVRHVEQDGLDDQAPDQAQFYTNFNQTSLELLPNSVRRINVLTRTETEPLSLVRAIRGEIAALNKDQAVFNVRTMDQILAQSVATRRFSMLLLSVFAAVALVLACIGLYGMMSYVVAQRAREIGVRMALGARARDVLNLVIGHGMRLAFAGVAIGVLASLALTKAMKGLLFGVEASDPMTLVAIGLLLTLVALLACWIPARRATRVDPVSALRAE